MDDKKPSVIPTQEQIAEAQAIQAQQQALYDKEITNADDGEEGVHLTHEEYETANATANELAKDIEPEVFASSEVTVVEQDANSEMVKRRNSELAAIKAQGKGSVKRPDLAFDGSNDPEKAVISYGTPMLPPSPPSTPIDNGQSYQQPANNPQPQQQTQEPYYSEGINEPMDLIPIPSGGLIYPHQKGKLSISYLTAADENILTSPNLLESGEFLNVLLNRKLLDKDIRAEDLHIGDRNAILIWLRSTGYGHIYPITVSNPETDEIIETEVDLSKLAVKPLGAKPDKEGLFDFTLPKSGKRIKFKLLSMGDITDIGKQASIELNEQGAPYSNSVTYRIEKQIIDIDGNRNINFIRDFIKIMPAYDSFKFRQYSDSIESGIDLNIEIRTPSGESFRTYLPIGFDFFYPEEL